MANAPILILQMQRMGDLVLTFPLISWLLAEKRGHPIWVAGDERFFEALLPLGPEAVYFSYSAAPGLERQKYHLAINLSNRPEAAALAGKVQADAHFGPVRRNGSDYIHGNWQLYRASIVHNNRHNHYHWADLNALDVLPPIRLRGTFWPEPEKPSARRAEAEGRIGLFLGASEPDKHPDARFWADLAALLLRRGLKPVLLGGEAELPLGRQVASLLNAPALNLCGKFTLTELGEFFQSLCLLVTPDTGPMHLAAWTRTLTLNLSLGPVNAWETAPAPPGHFVLRPTVSCGGCWRCNRPGQRCRAAFTPQRAALFIQTILRDAPETSDMPDAPSALGRLHTPGMELFRTERGPDGLFRLNPLDPGRSPLRQLIGDFWKACFARQFGLQPESASRALWERLNADAPALSRFFAQSTTHLAATLARSLRGGQTLPPSFWQEHPPLLRPLTGYLQLALQNQDNSRAAWAEALGHVGALAEIVKKS